ncbi:hypothetical protein Trydic_g4178 [Trypoxylus dichotomus]
MKTLVWLSQRESFSKELSMLKNTKNISKRNLARFSPFLDHEGLIRVDGRLKNSNSNFDKKYPVLISGPQHVLASVRENYWLTGGRNLAQVVHRCIACFKTNSVSGAQLMGNLPKHRLESIYPFYVTGTDYAGPFALNNKPGRGAKTVKCYLCIFICLTTKASLESVSNLTSAKSQLDNLGRFLLKNNESLSNTVSVENVNWHFIPAYSARQGGLWEAGVKSVKHHIKRVLGTTLVTFENFLTILNIIKAILNSRPMYSLSSSPNDFEPITPSHFLIGRKVTSCPDPDVTTQPVNRLASLQLIQRLTQIFWKRWSVNYVSELEQRTKWTRRNDNITIGSLVLVKDDNAPPLQWQLGRVIDVHPGSDSVVRVVSVRTNKSITKRSVMKICPLPINNESGCDITEHN